MAASEGEEAATRWEEVRLLTFNIAQDGVAAHTSVLSANTEGRVSISTASWSSFGK